MKKLTFLSRHYPPNPNINGESVWDLVKYLREKSGMVHNVLCIKRSSSGGGSIRKPEGNVRRIKTLYQGENPLFRFVAFLYDGFMLAKKALNYSETFIICTTSPPLLPFWASLIFGKKINWALWAFDLFPEGFVVTNTIKKKNIFYRIVKNITYRRYPSFIIALGPQQAKYLKTRYKKDLPVITLPCGVLFYQEKTSNTPDWFEKDKIFLGYCGNLNNAHNPQFVKAVIDNIDPDRHRLILALYGIHAEEVKAYAKGKPGIHIVTSVPRDQLHFIDIHLVSLRKEWTHIAVPSKAVSAICSGSSIMFCGDKESDNWFMLQKAGWFIEENDKSINREVKGCLEQLNRENINIKKKEAEVLYTELKAQIVSGYEQVEEYAK